jgi:hypothetical protein
VLTSSSFPTLSSSASLQGCFSGLLCGLGKPKKRKVADWIPSRNEYQVSRAGQMAVVYENKEPNQPSMQLPSQVDLSHNLDLNQNQYQRADNRVTAWIAVSGPPFNQSFHRRETESLTDRLPLFQDSRMAAAAASAESGMVRRVCFECERAPPSDADLPAIRFTGLIDWGLRVVTIFKHDRQRLAL